MTNSLQMDLIPANSEDEWTQITGDPECGVTDQMAAMGKLMFKGLTSSRKSVILCLLKTVRSTVNGIVQATTNSDSLGSFLFGLRDIDPNASFEVNFLRSRDGGVLVAGSETDGDKYDNSYYEHIDTEYYLYFENRAWNDDVPQALAENAELKVYEMNSSGFVFTPVESSIGDSWMNASAQASDVALFSGWEDYTRMDKETGKSCFPTSFTTASSGFNNYEVNDQRVVALTTPIQVPYDTNLTYNNIADYTPARSAAEYVYRQADYPVRLVKHLGNATDATTMDIPLQYDTNAPAAPSLQVDDQPFDPNTIYNVTNCFQLNAAAVAQAESPETVQYSINGGAWQAADFRGMYVPAGSYTLRARTIDAAGNTSRVESYQVMVEEPDKAYALVTSVTAGGQPYTGQWTNQNMVFTLVKEGPESDNMVFAWSKDDGPWNRLDASASSFTATQTALPP